MSKFKPNDQVYAKSFGGQWKFCTVEKVLPKQWWRLHQPYLLDQPTQIMSGGAKLYTKHHLDVYPEKRIVKA